MSFYQTNSRILNRSIKGSDTIDFNKYPDLLDILFNHWISQKENYNRLNKNIERGEFEISRSIIMDEFGIKETKAKNLIKRFVDDEIIKLKKRGNSSSKRSIYVYLSALDKIELSAIKKTKLETKLETKQRPSKTLKNQYVEGDEEPSKDQVKDQANTHSKKELIKKNYKKDIYSASSEALWKLYPHKKGKTSAMKKIPKLIEQYGFEQMETCIKRYIKYVEHTRKTKYNLSYQMGSTFFNGTYADYLDENYEGQPIEEKPKEEFSVFGTDVRI